MLILVNANPNAFVRKDKRNTRIGDSLTLFCYAKDCL